MSSLLIAGICLFNVVIDPTLELGFVGTHALNRGIPAKALPVIWNHRSPESYKWPIARASADTFLIGTSRELRGFDICDRPNMLRVAGSSWNIRDMAFVERAILSKRTTPATVLIEIGLLGDPTVPERNPNVEAGYVALSPSTTRLSAETIVASLTGRGRARLRDEDCSPLQGEPKDWTAAAKRFEDGSRAFDTGEESSRRGRAILDEMLKAADESCAATGIRHNIVFFSLPGTPDLPKTQLFNSSLERNGRSFDALFRAVSARGACHFRYANFISSPPGSAAERLLWRDPAQWLDFTHFSPGLGRIALDAILQIAGQEQGRPPVVAPAPGSQLRR